MTRKSITIRFGWLALLGLALLTAGCKSDADDATPDYPVTVIPPDATATAILAPLPTDTPAPIYSPTIDWGQVTLLPLKTPEAGEEESAAAETAPPETNLVAIPDPFTQTHQDLLSPAQAPFNVSSTEISLGRLILPVNLLELDQQFSVQSMPIADQPGWTFLAFDLPLPAAEGELGLLVHAPFGGEVLAGSMQMLNEETVNTISIDHVLSPDQLIRATFVYSGEVEPLFAMGQEVPAGAVLFRLTRDTGRVDTLGDTPIPEGATFTLHASIDSVVEQESGVQALKFLRGVSLSPGGLLRDDAGHILSPVE